MSGDVAFRVRSGLGTVSEDGREFTDIVETVARKPRQHTGWQSITYQGRRYQLFGGVRTSLFICLNNPIRW
jgi:hypothetical protein